MIFPVGVTIVTLLVLESIEFILIWASISKLPFTVVFASKEFIKSLLYVIVTKPFEFTSIVQITLLSEVTFLLIEPLIINCSGS